MAILILTIGLDSGWARNLNQQFRPPHYRIEHRRADAGALDPVHWPAPRIIVIGPQGQSFEERLRLTRRIKTRSRQLPIILVNQESSEARAVAALKAGVNDYFTMPIRSASLYQAMERLMARPNGHAALSRQIRPNGTGVIVGHGPVMTQIKRYLARVAGADSTVLITGETGTGKELLAQTIHANSPRAQGPMVCVNCAAIPENLVESELFGYHKGAFTGATANQKGKFTLADRGTLFLDEIGEMSLFSQAKILRCMEDDEVFPLGAPRSTPLNVRIIAATNQCPEVLVDQGKFRADLYYRLNVAHIHLPPLRERKEDIPDLVAMGVDHLNRSLGRDVQSVSDEAMAAMVRYSWPGNVRELNNLLESAFIRCESKRIEFLDLPQAFVKKISYCTPGGDEKERLLLALAGTRWNKSEAARKLQWSRMRIYRSLKRYNLVEPCPPDK